MLIKTLFDITENSFSAKLQMEFLGCQNNTLKKNESYCLIWFEMSKSKNTQT